MLRTLCILVSQTINDELIQFYSLTLLTENLVSEETFLATILASKDQVINMTASSFQTSLSVLRAFIQGNGLLNRLGSNYRLMNVFLAQDAPFMRANVNMFPSPDKCKCDVSSYCKANTGIYSLLPTNSPGSAHIDYPYMQRFSSYDIRNLFNVSGIYVGCVILDAVLQSDLSCLYNSSCLSQLNNYLNNSLYPFNATPLNSVSYSSLPTVNDLIENLMVDEWIFNSSYQSYFSQCNSSICTYTYTKQFDVLFMITTVIGSIGGIVTILMLVTLPLVTFIRRFVYRRRQQQPMIQTEIDRETPGSLRQNFQATLLKTKDFVISFNLFKDPYKQSAHDLNNQRITTRVFIILMIITLSLLILYTSLTIVTETVTVRQPTTDVYTVLQTKYSQTLVCPCTQITIDYEKFISFHPTFHQICSSDFITTQWINFFLTDVQILATDIRNVAPLYYRTLSAFCNLSVDTINNALLIFNFTKYVTKNVQQINLFQSQTQQIVNLFKKSTANSYLQAFSVYREMFSGNALFSGLLTSYRFSLVGNSSNDEIIDPYIFDHYYDNGTFSYSCSCKTDPSTCGIPGRFANLSGNHAAITGYMSGFWYGCYTVEALFQSTFICYFNQSCLDQLYKVISSVSLYPFNATAMIYNSSNTQYQNTTKIQQIVEHLMIEQWNDQISFTSYYQQCNPQFCVYTYNKQGDLTYIFTTIIGLIGGLTTIFRIIIPPIVKFIRRNKRPQLTETEVEEYENATSSIRKYSQMLTNFIKTLNLFKDPNERSIEQIQHQRIYTRIFIILLSFSLVIILIYVSVENITQIVTVKNPSIDQFNQLYQRYSDNLQCPCKTLSIQYQNFIQFNPQFHSVCTSDLVTSRTWLNIDYPRSEFTSRNTLKFHAKIDDFRHISSPLFELLNSSCQLSSQTVNITLLTFNSTTFTTSNLISREQFSAQTSQIIVQFIENTAHSFLSNFWFVNNMTAANMLVSALLSDSALTVYPQYYYDGNYDYNGYVYEYTYEYIFDRRDQIYNSTVTGSNCDCQENSFCVQQAVVYDLNGTTAIFHIPGIYVGCYLIEGLLQSDLQCFYDDLCLQKLIDSLNISTDTSPLSNSTSKYKVTTNLLEILSNLMIEQWNNESSYENYFNECQPNECSITYVNRGNIIYIITTMTGLIGGLTKFYLFITPLVVALILFVISQFKQKNLVNNRIAALDTMARKPSAHT
ncbi:unnamed protein product [Adineta steineri]|uniref:Uncharacterized protein n=1 Tax=Adineta steineri TaxID=433720 RepID=A0A815I6U2_9BILA|nr:unnamed protein product [Adineta steineri]CAF1601396.1 unnamed protein product [Adineta steineri]